MRYTSKITLDGKSLIKMYALYNIEVELVFHGKNSYSARGRDAELVAIYSLESTVRGFEVRTERLELDINDGNKRIKELGEKVGAKFEHEDRYQDLTRPKSEIEEEPNLPKNQAPSRMDVTATDEYENNSLKQTQTKAIQKTKRKSVRL